MVMAASAAAGNLNSVGLDVRGVVLTPEDLRLWDWPERAKRAGLSTIALHPTPSAVAAFVRGEAGKRFLARCRELGLQVEYELHAMRELLPRELFAAEPALFRMNEKGERTADANLCVHSSRALEIAAESACRIARELRPSSSRYFYWGDDGAPWCRCPDCHGFSDSDQALILENHLHAALRKQDRRATLAHLAYANTLAPPTRVKPARGVFLEFAPIDRRYDVPLGDPANRKWLELLEGNLKWFGARNAQALEYWLDVSRFSLWRKPAVKLPWNGDLVAKDIEAYAARGVRRITTFAVYIDSDYVSRHGEPPLDEYGRLLRRAR